MDTMVLQKEEVNRLLSADNGDAALLFLYLKDGGAPEKAAAALHFSPSRLDCAAAALRGAGLLAAVQPGRSADGAQAQCSDEALLRALEQKQSGFRQLVGEVQRRFGRTLSTEELRTLLSITENLGLPYEVVGALLSYCIERGRRRGKERLPSVRVLEQEACRWADEGIDTLEAAGAYMQRQLERYGDAAQIGRMLQITDRRLTPGEERYILSWLDMGFGEEELRLAYDRTCLGAGGLKWRYLDTIVKKWDAAGLHTVAQIEAEDAKPTAAQEKRGRQYQRHDDAVSPLGRRAIQQLLEEEDGSDGI
jgi:hypothetical protein